MTDKEKLRAEIKRLKEIHERNLNKPMERGRIGYAHGCVDCCDRILSFIDSLPEEPSCPKESDDLEEAAEKYSKRVSDGHNYRDLTCGFKAGAEWQREQDKPITGNSLEKEWLRYVNKKKKEYGGELPSLGDYGWLQIARHFAEWQKRKMMKDAIEGEVVKDISNKLAVTAKINLVGFKFGQKVKIIIIKDDGYDK